MNDDADRWLSPLVDGFGTRSFLVAGMRQFIPAIERVSVRSLKGPTRVTRDVIARLRSEQIAASIGRFGFSTPMLIADKSASGDGGGGRYIPDWERLLDAVKRVMAIGLKEGEAKLDLCRAISDRKIKIRFLVAKEEGFGSFGEIVQGIVRQGSDVDIPSHLDPRDFDWLQSRPRKPWRDIRGGFSVLATHRGSLHNDAVARASRHVNAREASSKNFIPTAFLAKPPNPTRIYAGE